ncbi:protein kinase [Bacillus sp. RG28]|uniref:Protein kinase n=1 Tax=Gottfriedia endophytica TaxID=2820819 RepID=A0A940NSU0_9BACI|nr:serine/threonine-protein kinase [Gottfriedia endophytica]MBP0726397.1 protein kinase [Gottfriedia endophytica]
MILANKYELKEKMLGNYQSTIYSGITIKGKTPIVAKILNQNYSNLEFRDLQEIFHRDSKALSMINHSNIIEYKDSGIEGDNFYIVMEHFQGETLEMIIQKNNLSKIEKLHIMFQILNGVQAAHDKRIIHRDIKPSNVLVNSQMEVKVIDFGISKIMDMYSFRTGHTLKDHITKRYSSPEHLLGQQIDFRSDIFSLGATFYYLITGIEPPEDKVELINSVDFLPLSQNLKDILKKALGHSKEDRYRSLISFIEDLKQEISLNVVDGNIKLFIPQIINRNLQDLGKVTNTHFNVVKDFIEQSLIDSTIYKTENHYYLIGNGIKYHLLPDKKNGYLKVIKVYSIDKYHENELEKSKGIEIKLNLDITQERSSGNESSDLNKLLNDIDMSFDAFKQKIKKTEQKNKLIADWEEVLKILKQINFNRERIGNYEGFEYEVSNNFLTITMDSNYDSSMLQDGDYIKLQTKTNKFVSVGPIKSIKENKLKVALLSDVEVENLSKRGETRVDLSMSNKMLKRYSNALYSLKNNESVNRNLIDFLINPEQLTMKKIELNLDFVNQNIDETNKAVVQKTLKTNDIFIIQGPPGTGKSTVITELINQIFLQDSKSTVLITSPSHVAVDHLLKNVHQTHADKKIIRIGTSDKISKDAKNLLATEQIKAWAENVKSNSISNTIEFINQLNGKDKTLSKYMQFHLNKNTFIKPEEIDSRLFDSKVVDTINIIKDWTNRLDLLDEFDDIFAREASIVAATCVGIASRHTLRNLTYDWVIIDEAARATAPELILPMLLGKKIILVGDHKQLPPIVNLVQDKGLETEINVKKLEKSLFEDIFESCSPDAKETLTSQFRMHPEISKLVNTSFYPTYRINTKVKVEDRKHNLDFNEVIRWIDTANLSDNMEEKFNDSYRNNLEVRVIKNELEKINKIYNEKNLQASVAIISGYNAQKQLLINKIEPKNPKWTNIEIQIDNIDAFQGSECEIVFYSVVRSNEENKLGFLKDQRRINVALSRGKNCLFIVGNKECVLNSDVKYKEGIGKVVQYITRNPNSSSVKGAEL